MTRQEMQDSIKYLTAVNALYRRELDKARDVVEAAQKVFQSWNDLQETLRRWEDDDL